MRKAINRMALGLGVAVFAAACSGGGSTVDQAKSKKAASQVGKAVTAAFGRISPLGNTNNNNNTGDDLSDLQNGGEVTIPETTVPNSSGSGSMTVSGKYQVANDSFKMTFKAAFSNWKDDECNVTLGGALQLSAEFSASTIQSSGGSYTIPIVLKSPTDSGGDTLSIDGTECVVDAKLNINNSGEPTWEGTFCGNPAADLAANNSCGGSSDGGTN